MNLLLNNTTDFVITSEQKEYFINKFPENLRGHLRTLNNPLNEKELILSLFQEIH